jgi:hypothetical protein
MLTAERWAAVPGAADYEVSDVGNLRRVLPDGSHRPLRPTRNSKGYRKVTLGTRPCDDPSTCRTARRAKRHRHRRTEYVHRLVWWAFRGPIPDDMRVDHVDDDQLHNALANLQLLTNADNVDKRWGRWQDDDGWGEYTPRSASGAVA